MEHDKQDDKQVFTGSARMGGSPGFGQWGEHESRWSAIVSISSKIRCAPQTLNDWVEKAEVDRGERAGVTSASINTGYRVVLKLEIQDGEIILVNMGNHDQVYQPN